jgi:hypothetical protein
VPRVRREAGPGSTLANEPALRVDSLLRIAIVSAPVTTSNQVAVR